MIETTLTPQCLLPSVCFPAFHFPFDPIYFGAVLHLKVRKMAEPRRRTATFGLIVTLWMSG